MPSEIPEDLTGLADLLAKGLHKLAVQTFSEARFPRGRWLYSDGREVLFDIFYRPVWQRDANGLVTAADRSLYDDVRPIREEHFFQIPRLKPWQDYEGMRDLRALVLAWAWTKPRREDWPGRRRALARLQACEAARAIDRDVEEWRKARER